MENTHALNSRRRPSRQGIALVLVLMLIGLATILVVAMLATVQTDSKSSHAMMAVQNAQQLADLAQQTAMAQIQQATTQGPTVAWASQPGMIRCYDNTGTATMWYKLYSASQMVLPAPATSDMLSTLQSDVPTSNCSLPGTTSYGIFTDINSPAYASDGSLTYPIVDPSGAKSIAASGQSVLGFDVQNTSPNLTQAPGYVSTATATPTNNPAAMPVRWLYVLADSTLVAGQSGFTPGQVLVAGATKANPIVGRVAFWTDDETCKLNVNTAGDGTYYDTPHFGNAITPAGNPGLQYSGMVALTPAQRDAQRIIDQQLAFSPPVANEYQRYIGHPAQTRLSYLFPSISALDLGSRSQVFSSITPFVQWGGSEAGLYTYWDNLPALANPVRQSTYASLDEWMFSSLTGTTTPPARLPNTDLNGNAIVTGTSLQKLRFFLSATSEAPEVNLFGQPRICMWPIASQLNLLTQAASPTPYATTTDQLIATASTLISGSKTYPYYFARNNSQSPTADYTGIPRNPAIFEYLRNLASSPIPGYGGTFNNKYQQAEMDQILAEIFDYIRCTDPSDTLLLTGTYQYAKKSKRDVSTLGVTGQYSSGSGQVLPITIQPNGASYTARGFGRFYSIDDISIDFTQSQPSFLPSGTSTGTLSGMSGTGTATDPNTIVITPLIHVDLYCPSAGPPDIIPDIRVQVDGLNDATGTLSITTTPASNPVTQTLFQTPGTFTTSSSNPRTVFSAIPEVVAPGVNASYNWQTSYPVYWFTWGGATGIRQLTLYKGCSDGLLPGSNTTDPTPTPAVYTHNYMLCGRPIKIPKGSTIHFPQSPLKITLSWADLQTDSNGSNDPSYNIKNGDGFPAGVSPTSASNDVVQTINVTFPAFDAPAPINKPYISNTLTMVGMYTRLFNTTYSPKAQGGGTDPILSGDTVRSLVAGYNGDSRLIAAQATLTGTVTGTTTTAAANDSLTQPFVFLPVSSGTINTSHAMREIFPNLGGGNNSFMSIGFTGAGPLLTAPTYGPCVPVNGYVADHTGTLTSAPDVTGDWDTGVGVFPDGPYINRPDEAALQYIDYATGSVYNALAYYWGNQGGIATGLIYTSPNRTVASPVLFGSLSTGVPINGLSPVPWRTLLFRPQPTHFGATSPKDELLLDWFWMPVVDPYAISTTFATAGKVNMNYQIAPFTYITRASSLLGVLGSEYVITVPTTAGTVYKTSTAIPGTPYRLPVRVLDSDGISLDFKTGSLGQFKQRFDTGEIFKSATEICDINLVPNLTPASTGPFDSTSASAVSSYWAAHALSGDNIRERPYNGLYPRLTTKSNTFTVHVRAQSLKQPPTATAGIWVENPQLIQSEYRGSVIVNRYLDPLDPNIPDFANSVNYSKSIDSYYKYRVLETRRFLP